MVERNNWSRTQTIMAVIIIIMVSGFIWIYFWEPEESIIFKESEIVGVIEVFGVIDDNQYSYVLSSAVEEAIFDDSVKAVVLEIDSPGGSAYLIEQVYYDLLQLKVEKPVVASISMALSGGYYIAVSAEYIYALPSAMVGNVGVIGTGPGWVVPSETTLETGPHKITGFSPELFPFNLTTVLRTFSDAVVTGRGETLNIPISSVNEGSIWMGIDAKSNGLVDELGSLQAAIKFAAELAEIEDYEVESLVSRVANNTDAIGVYYPSLAELIDKNPPPAIYYLYLPENVYVQSETPENDTKPVYTGTVKGDVLVDTSHGNTIGPWVLDTFTRLLTEEGLFVGYCENWDDLEAVLNDTKALVVASPSDYYSHEEYEIINSWLNKGGILILLGDASADFLNSQTLQAPLNSLSNHWGIHYGNGYLYNMETNYGFYRNIIVDNIRDSFLSEGVNELVFFTTGPVYSKSRGYASPSDDTYNSVTERVGEYDTIAIYKVEDSRVVAFGDTTWLMEPYVNTADNYQLLKNLVEAIASIE
ncbi:S49 family peptidase [Thermoproteota archaeon]